MKTRKIVALVLITSLCMGLAGCAQKQSTDNQNSTEKEETVKEESSNVEKTEETSDATENQKDTLVVYFSATGNTKAIAENITNGLSADIYEIVPEDPYTDADLDYNDNSSRSTAEMNNPSTRPAISGNVENMGQYSRVFIGYPKMEYGFSLCI